MPPEAVVFYCDGQYADKYKDEVEKLKEHGIEVMVDEYEGAARHDYLLFDDSSCRICQPPAQAGSEPSPGTVYWYRHKYTKQSARLIVYSHSIDDGPSDSSLPEGSFALHPYEWSFLKDTGEGVFMKDEKGRFLVSRSEKNIERVVMGMTHLAGVKPPKNLAEKEALKKEMAKKIGIDLNPDLPLILFSWAPLEADEVNRGLMELSKHANIIVKYYPHHPYLGHFDRVPDASGPNIFYSTDHGLNAIMRLAADINLASYISSVFVSCVAHNLRTIPVCTHRMSSIIPKGVFAYSFYFNFLQKAYARLARNIGPVNIAFTDKILDRLHNEDYWREYHDKLPEIISNIFGNFITGDEAAKLGAHHVMNVLQYGSFVTPDLKRKGTAFKGRANLNTAMLPIAL